MALTDLLKGAGRVVQAAALGLAVQGCGGSEKKYTCDDLCRQLLDCCNYAPDPEECINDIGRGQGHQGCVNDCLGYNIPSDYIECWVEKDICDKTEGKKQCGEPD